MTLFHSENPALEFGTDLIKKTEITKNWLILKSLEIETVLKLSFEIEWLFS